MRYLKNKILLILIAGIISILIFAFFNFDEEGVRDKAILSSLDSMQGINRIYDAENNVLENCSFIKYQDTLELNYAFYQNYDESVPYVFLIIVDNKQQEFYVEEKLYKKYYFTLDDLQYKNIKIKINLKDASSESLLIATYKEPDYFFDSDNFSDGGEKWMSLITNYTYLTRFFIKDSVSEDLSFKNDFDKKMHLPILKAKDEDRAFSGYSNTKWTLHFFMDPYREEMSYSLIYLLNYEQIGMEENKDIITVKANTSSVKTEFTLPDVAELSPFNILIIPNYSNLKDGIDARVKNSTRIDIIPSQN